VQLHIKLAQPVFEEETGIFKCFYEIAGLGRTVMRHAAGIDAFQALQLSFIAIGAHIVYLERDNNVTFQFRGEDVGFPR
jgi:hypothetical protein